MPTYSDLNRAVELATRAPSVHNTQPWKWRIRPDAVELYADWNRHLIVTDPDRRDLLLSCGAALHHLQVVLAAAGFGVMVERFPDLEDRGHLATVAVGPGPADLLDAALFPGIAGRRTDRRRMSHRPVSRDHLRSLVDRAERAGALLLPVTDPARRQSLVSAIADAARHQRREPGYPAELRTWTNRYAGGGDGVPATNVAGPALAAHGPSPLRRFTHAQLDQAPQRVGTGPLEDDAAELLVIATSGDDPLDQLRAGEATSAVLLAATVLGLGTTPLSQALEVASSRELLQRDVLHVPEQPQLVIRVGWPATAADPLPETPRRSLRSVLLPA